MRSLTPIHQKIIGTGQNVGAVASRSEREEAFEVTLWSVMQPYDLSVEPHVWIFCWPCSTSVDVTTAAPIVKSRILLLR